jgi:hypothetical protein
MRTGSGSKPAWNHYYHPPLSPRNKKHETWTTGGKQTRQSSATGQQFISQDIHSAHDIKKLSKLFSLYLTANKMTGRIQ